MTESSDDDLYPLLKDNPGFLHSIQSVELYATKILPFIPRGLPVYQSHGINHSRSLVIRLNQFLLLWNEFNISTKEAYLLYLAAWLHDTGYLHPVTITQRNEHGERSCEMIRTVGPLQNLIIRRNQINALETIIRSHDTHVNLSRIEDHSPVGRTRLLAAIFRLIDSLDIGIDRCPRDIFEWIKNSLDERAVTHWRAHNNVSGIIFAKPDIKILVHSREDYDFNQTIMPHLEKDVQSVNSVFEHYQIEPVHLLYSEVRYSSNRF